MPSYSWACDKHLWVVASTVAERDSPQNCPRCGATGERQIDLPNIDKFAAGSWNSVEYNPGLGCWTKGTKHAEQIAKSRGLEPIGNEPPEKIHKFYEKQREETRERRWEEAARVKVYE